MNCEYIQGFHRKGKHNIYSEVPSVMTRLLDSMPIIEGFVIGGSYACGRFQSGDDVDFDVLFETYPDPVNMQILLRRIAREFRNQRIIPEIRAPLARLALPDQMRQTLYNAHPETPYVVRRLDVIASWGLMVDHSSENSNSY